jgi:hypothetical protein
MRLTASLPQFEEPEEALSPATLNDAVNAFLNFSEQGRFEEHFIAALWIYDFVQGGLLGGGAIRLISHLSAPVGEAFALTIATALMAPSHSSSLSASRCLACFLRCTSTASLPFSPIFATPFLTVCVSVTKSPFRKCPPSAFSADSMH